MIIFLIILILTPIILWLFLFANLNDFSLPSKHIKNLKKVLVIFPHPDDEALTCGGLMKLFSEHGIKVSHLILTLGEKGNEKGIVDNYLKKRRLDEALKVKEILHTDNLIFKDLGDGELDRKKKEVKIEIEKTIMLVKPDLVITYDLTGLYGHPDHIAVSETVTEIITNKYPKIRLWYVSLPKIIMRLIQLPTHMAKNINFRKNRVFPTHKIFIGRNILGKIKVVRAYKSQIASFKKGLPVKFIPMEFFHSITLFEYFYEFQK